MRSMLCKRVAAMLLAVALAVGLLPAAVAADSGNAALEAIQAANDLNNFDYEYTTYTVTADGNGIVSTSFDMPGNAKAGSFYAAILPVNADDTPVNGKDVRYVRLSDNNGKLALTYFRDGCSRFQVMVVQPQPGGGDSAIASNPQSIIHATSSGTSATYTVAFTATMNMSEAVAQIADLNRNNPKMNDLIFTAHIRFDSELNVDFDSIRLNSDIFTFQTADIAKNPDGENGFDIKCTLRTDWKDTAAGQTLVQKLQKKMTFTGTATITGENIVNMVNGGQNALYVVGWSTIENIPISAVGGSKLQVPSVTYALPISVNNDSGGGDGGGSRYYTVTVQQSGEGTVTVSHNRAHQGTRVTVEVNPANEYRVNSVAVVRSNNNSVAVTDNKNGTYVFTMPASNVVVKVEFVRAIADPDDTGVSDNLNTKEHMAYMIGDDHGNFRPDARISRAEVAQIFYRLLKNKNLSTTITFNDVPADAWYADAVYALAAQGIIKGVGGNRCEPERAITRAEFAAIAARFANVTSVTVTFSDVPVTHWAYKEISTAATYGWVIGVGGGLFAPDKLITRAEATTMVNRMLGRLGDHDAIDAGKVTKFPDVTSSHWAWYDIGEATTTHDYTMGNGVENWVD